MALNKNVLLVAIAPIIWGSTMITCTELLSGWGPFEVAYLRALPIGFLALLFYKFKRPKNMKRTIVLSLLNISIFFACLNIVAYSFSGKGGLATTVMSSHPLVVLFIVWFFYKKKPSVLSFTAIITGIAGLFLLLGVEGNTETKVIGFIAIAIGLLSWSFGQVLSHKWLKDEDAMLAAGWQLFIGGIILLPISFILGEKIPEITTQSILGISFMAIFATGLAYYTFFKGITKISVVTVSILGLLSPITAYLLDITTGVTPTVTEIIGTLMVVSAIVIHVMGEGKNNGTKIHTTS